MGNNVPIGCLPFDIEAVKQGAKVVTRHGKDAAYHGHSFNHDYPYFFIIEGEKFVFTENGTYLLDSGAELDLFLLDYKYVGTENPQEQPYEVTMIASLPEKQISNPEFEFKQEIAAQFVFDAVNNDMNKTYQANPIDKGLSRYKEFLQRSKEFFSTTQAPE